MKASHFCTFILFAIFFEICSSREDFVNNGGIQDGRENPNYEVLTPDLSAGWNLTFSLFANNLGDNMEPYVKASYSEKGKREVIEFGQTEFENGEGSTSNDPVWNKVLSFIRHEGVDVKWFFKVHDKAHGDQLLGETEVNVDTYVESGQNLVLPLKDGLLGKTGSPKLTIKKTESIFFKLSAKNIGSHDEFGTKSDPYVKAYFRRGPNGDNHEFYKTSTLDNEEHPNWDDRIEFSHYQRGTNQYLFFEIYDKDTWSKDDNIGEALVNVDQYIAGKGPETVYLENADEHASLTITPTY